MADLAPWSGTQATGPAGPAGLEGPRGPAGPVGGVGPKGDRGVGVGLSVTDFGAVGDGVADDTAALARALDAIPAAGGTLFLPPGTYRTTAALTLARAGLRFIGAGRETTAIVNDVSDVLIAGTAAGALRALHMEGVKIQASAGHIFVTGGKGVEQSSFRQVWFNQTNGARSIWRSVNQGWFLNNTFEDYLMEHVDGATVPAFHLISANGDINANRWGPGRVYRSGEHFFHIENTAAGSWAFGNVWDQVTAEIMRGGFLRLLSGFGNVIRDVTNWDMAAIGASTRDWIVVGKSATGQNSIYTRVINLERAAGALGAGLVDVRLRAGEAPRTLIEGGDSATLGGFAVDLGPNVGCEVRAANTGWGPSNIDGTTVGVFSARGTAINQQGFVLVGGKKWLTAPGVPTVGGWAVGDRVFNSAPAAGQPKSWVCTVAGSPGTWVSEGVL